MYLYLCPEDEFEVNKFESLDHYLCFYFYQCSLPTTNNQQDMQLQCLQPPIYIYIYVCVIIQNNNYEA